MGTFRFSLALCSLALTLACHSKPSQEASPATEVQMVEWTLQGVGVVEDVGLLPWSPQQFPILLLDGKVLYGAGYYHDKQAPENVLVTIDPARSKGMIASPIDPEFDVSSTQVTLFDSQQRMLWIFTTTQGGVVGALLGPEGWEIEPTVLMPLEEEFPARVLGARYTEDGLECVLWPNSGFLEGYSRVERSDPVIMTLPKGGPVSFRFVTWDVLSREIPADQRLGHQEIPLAHFDEEVGAWSLLVKDGLGLREVTLTETPSVKALLYPEAPSSTTIFDKSRLGFSEGTLGLDRFLWTRRGLTYQPKGERPPQRRLWRSNRLGAQPPADYAASSRFPAFQLGLPAIRWARYCCGADRGSH